MAQTCFPDNGRSLPNIHLHPRHEGFFVQSCPNLLGRCGLEKELQCFTEIREGMFDTVSLAGNIQLPKYLRIGPRITSEKGRHLPT